MGGKNNILKDAGTFLSQGWEILIFNERTVGKKPNVICIKENLNYISPDSAGCEMVCNASSASQTLAVPSQAD